MKKKLIENCYWVVPDKILAGEYPGHQEETKAQERIQALSDFGVKVFIDLTDESQQRTPYAGFLNDVLHQWFPIKDVSVPESKAYTQSILDAIDGHIDQGSLVYTHCWGGIGRTGLIVGCWLSRHGYPKEEALSRLRELWSNCPKSEKISSPETREQEDYILSWKEEN